MSQFQQPKAWMVRASKGGRLAELFSERRCVALGWNCLGNLIEYADSDALQRAYINAYGDDKPAKIRNAVGMLQRFAKQIVKGDWVITYMPARRLYLLGEDLGAYRHVTESEWVGKYANLRSVNWLFTVPRDELSKTTQNSLGATLTLFSLNEAVINDLLANAQALSRNNEGQNEDKQLCFPGY